MPCIYQGCIEHLQECVWGREGERQGKVSYCLHGSSSLLLLLHSCPFLTSPLPLSHFTLVALTVHSPLSFILTSFSSSKVFSLTMLLANLRLLIIICPGNDSALITICRFFSVTQLGLWGLSSLLFTHYLVLLTLVWYSHCLSGSSQSLLTFTHRHSEDRYCKALRSRLSIT